MAISTLASIRAKLASQDFKSNKTTSAGDNAIFPFWNMDEGTTTTLRFLPDGNTRNEFFWVERAQIKLPVNGVKGDSGMKRVEVNVPCIEMYGPEHQCPILAEVRPWYKDESLKEMANKYWKKRSYLFQGFVRANPIGDDKAPANPIRRLVISPQLFTVIKASLMDPEMESMPTDYTRGLDLNIKKTAKGGYADYSTSTWSRKESALTEAEQSAIETYQLSDLSSFLPKMPTEAELRIIKEMFEASVDGKAYDNERWGNYFRPYGVAAPGGDASRSETSEAAKPAASFARAPVAPAPDLKPWEDDVADAEASFSAPAEAIVVPKAGVASDKASDILALIRARSNKTA